MLSNILSLSLQSTNSRNYCSLCFNCTPMAMYSFSMSDIIFCSLWLYWELSRKLYNPAMKAAWPHGSTTPNLLNNPRIWLLTAVLFLIGRSRIRCKQDISCLCTDLSGTKRIWALWLAPAIAKASLWSYYCLAQKAWHAELEWASHHSRVCLTLSPNNLMNNKPPSLLFWRIDTVLGSVHLIIHYNLTKFQD